MEENMIIQNIEAKRISVPLKKPFKTALRTVESLESILVKITCDNGMVGWGEASATVVITGDSIESIEAAILNTMKPQLIGLNLAVLKIKVGKDNIEDDILRIQEIRKSVGNQVKIRLDANQGWNVKEAIRSIRKMEDMGLGIELIEQPVKAHDLEGLKRVTDAVDTPIMADESVFSVAQALQVLRDRAADMINIKLMKAGGIFKAQLINQLAEEHGIPCMVGSMIESRLSVSAAAHFAASKKNITRFDFDAPLMLLHDGIEGGVTYDGRLMTMPDTPGLGIRAVSLWEGGEK
jgi:L-alanine-DL-glutamate epimerase-like enolase superfamily enzyme